ncbi:MAG TPA: alkaline phosphatase family protein [Verrucomicrobiae bacterium]
MAGTKPVVLLLDRGNIRTNAAGAKSTTLYQGKTIPSAGLKHATAANGDKAFPADVTYPNVAQDAWTTKALTSGLWRGEVPKFSVLWMSDPDFSQHDSGPGSEAAIGALDSVDRNLTSVVNALEQKKVLTKTDILVVSDHGFSTIHHGVDVAACLRRAGFNAARKFDDPEPGDVIVDGLGGSVFLYVVDHKEDVVRGVVDTLQASDFAGVIFSRIAIEGTFPLEQVKMAHANAPDIVVSMRWTDEASETGAPGMLIGESGKRGKGTHGSLSKYDMHNTLIAYGPDFKAGFVNEMPSGNADLVPTLLTILGQGVPASVDGRVLSEALTTSIGEPPKAEQKTVEASHAGTVHRWRQYLKYSTVGKAIYFDEGNGAAEVK